jgi:hypothetical protein
MRGGAVGAESPMPALPRRLRWGDAADKRGGRRRSGAGRLRHNLTYTYTCTHASTSTYEHEHVFTRTHARTHARMHAFSQHQTPKPCDNIPSHDLRGFESRSRRVSLTCHAPMGWRTSPFPLYCTQSHGRIRHEHTRAFAHARTLSRAHCRAHTVARAHCRVCARASVMHKFMRAHARTHKRGPSRSSHAHAHANTLASAGGRRNHLLQPPSGGLGTRAAGPRPCGSEPAGAGVGAGPCDRGRPGGGEPAGGGDRLYVPASVGRGPRR